MYVTRKLIDAWTIWPKLSNLHFQICFRRGELNLYYDQISLKDPIEIKIIELVKPMARLRRPLALETKFTDSLKRQYVQTSSRENKLCGNAAVILSDSF